MANQPVFLTGEWRYLAMLNYRVDASVLSPHLPRGTRLETFEGAHYVSLVGFLFENTKVRGFAIPFHRTFEEVNLRFYVTRTEAGQTRRGVTFIKEIVPKPAVAMVARIAYNEPYVAMPMRHSLRRVDGPGEALTQVDYSWKQKAGWSRITVEPSGSPQAIAPGSEQEFITEHYWGYTRQRDGGTVEYRVEHPQWRVWDVKRATVAGDMTALYGSTFAGILAKPPHSAFVADGSEISVGMPRRLAITPS